MGWLGIKPAESIPAGNVVADPSRDREDQLVADDQHRTLHAQSLQELIKEKLRKQAAKQY